MSAGQGLGNRDDMPFDGGTGVSIAVRESRRARQLRLQTRPPRTVEVVVPRGLRPQIVSAFIREHRDWISRAGLAMLRAYPEADLRPAIIDLKSIGERIVVRYLRAGGSRAGFDYDGVELRLYCRREDGSDHPALLRRWLLTEGSRVLKPWLAREAEHIGLHPKRVQVRLQKTRWGSCSARGNISVNAALLLVPPTLVRYLLVHELAHLSHLSHSERYWRTVAAYEPAYAALDRELALCWRSLPAWLFGLTGSGEC
jgi:predicted metal-dependent hydrolase